MMMYEKFKEKMKNVIEDYFADTQAIEDTRTKVNTKHECLILKSKFNVCPSFDLESEYQVYSEMQDDEAYFNRVLKIADKSFDDARKMDIDLDNATDKITFQLINAEKNMELLSYVPHKKFLNLAIIYRIIIFQEGEETASAVITKDMQHRLGLTDENLFTMSASNTLKMNPPQFYDMFNPFEMKSFDDIREIDLDEWGSEIPTFVITNKTNVFGAGSMLYAENLHKLAKALDSDLIILPSSIHEVIALPENKTDINELRYMVRSINDTERNESEILSYNLYRYSRDTKRITIVEGENGR